ncbi:hypothetical protein H5410_061924 [Solanum commersonii]|uniref:Uncharacterized protein n=1 Tax=Solanum commersonii TaxID=4109 RepID=A0A9J5WB37_SOLCO|nr:hypothetical protein H5410_061924 [Solanum commersonii]
MGGEFNVILRDEEKLGGLFVVQLKQTLEEWWKADYTTKLKPILKVVLDFIIWQLWKRRNVIKHDRSMSRQSILLEILRNVYLFTRYRCPQLKDIPKSWPLIVKFLEGYTRLIVRWLHPLEVNSKEILINSMAFCVIDEYGKMIHVE